MSREPVTPLTPEQQRQHQYRQQQQPPPPENQKTSSSNQPEEDDSDFVLVVNRKKNHQPVDPRKYHHNNHRQSDSNYYYEEDHHHGTYNNGRRRKYRDRGGGGGGADTRGGNGDHHQKGYVRKPRGSSKHDKENIKTAPAAAAPTTPPPHHQQQRLSPQPPQQIPSSSSSTSSSNPTQSNNSVASIPTQRCYSLVVACGTTTPTRIQHQPLQQQQQQLTQKSTQTETIVPQRTPPAQPELPGDDDLARTLVMVDKPKDGGSSSVSVGPSTSSSIPDTSSLTSEETLDSMDRKTSSEVGSSSNGDHTLHVVEYVDAPAPRVNPWVANRNAAQVIIGTGSSTVALSGFPTVAETLVTKNNNPVSSAVLPGPVSPSTPVTHPQSQKQQQTNVAPPDPTQKPTQLKNNNNNNTSTGSVGSVIPQPPKTVIQSTRRVGDAQELPKKPETLVSQQKQHVGLSQQQPKQCMPSPPPPPPPPRELHENVHDQSQEQSVYVREMSNGFRPGRGRGSYSGLASAGRRIPSRSSVLMMKVVANEPDDWPTLGQTVIPATKKPEESLPPQDGPNLEPTPSRKNASPPTLLLEEYENGPVVSVPSSTQPVPPPRPTTHPHQNQTETSSSDNDDELNPRNQRRGSKQKWVPLDMTSSERRSSNNGENVQPPHQQHQGQIQPVHDGHKQKTSKAKRAYSSSYYYGTYQRSRGKENVAINGGNDYSDYNPHHPHANNARYPSSNGGRSTGNHRSTSGASRGVSQSPYPQNNSARTRRHTQVPHQQQQHNNHHHHVNHHHNHHHLAHVPRSTSTLSLNNHPLIPGTIQMTAAYELLASPTQPTSVDFQDFSGDFTTTLTPMYPAVSDFIMPYVANGYFPTPFTPPAGVIVDTTTTTEVVATAANPILLAPVTTAVTTTQPVAAAVLAATTTTTTVNSQAAAFTNGDIGMLTDLVRTQIEYYFSEQNLTKDFYLRRQMDVDGYLAIHTLATFPRVAHMTQDYSTLLTAIQSSDCLELKPDLSGVRTNVTPEKWPIPDPRQARPSDDLTRSEKKCINNNNNNTSKNSSGVAAPVLLLDRVETLNPNVPEFVPKSKVTLF